MEASTEAFKYPKSYLTSQNFCLWVSPRVPPPNYQRLFSMEKMVSGEDRKYEPIIPGLPDDLALRCLAKMSHGYHGLLESVCRNWRNAIRSLDYSNLKASEKWTGNWLLVAACVEGETLWDAYDPDAGRWHPLPQMPTPASCFSYGGFSCATVCKRLMVIGGFFVSLTMQRHVATNDVVLFDPFKKQWNRAASMRTARSDFACVVISGKVYVAGGGNANDKEGHTAAEVYDPIMNSWEDLPPMPFSLVECFSISYGGQFHVVGRRDYNVQQDTYVIFNPADYKWRVMEDLWPFSKLMHNCTTVLDDCIYTILDEGVVKIIDTDSKDWSAIGLLPEVVLPDHSRPLKHFGFVIVGFQKYLYVVGGLTLKYNSVTRAYCIVKLNSVRFVGPKNLPLKWQDATPMSRLTGGVIGCASIEE